MKWIKKGLIIEPGKYEWMVSHAQNPFPENLGGGLFKIHFASRDKRNRARGGWAVIDIAKEGQLVELFSEPTLNLGDLGCFDDSGIMPSCLVNHSGLQYMYYTGWSQAVTTPFTFFIGLSISKDGGESFQRYSKAPVLGRSLNDPYLSCSPWIIKEEDVWKMWYVSGTGWETTIDDSDPKHYYNIKYAESDDGIYWRNEGVVCIGFEKEEYAIARPTVYKENGIYKMFYCYRGGYNRYRAGYAESEDGKQWQRKDAEVGIDTSNTGWDSEMICYPCILNYNETSYLLYNGNDYGRTGCGLAILK